MTLTSWMRDPAARRAWLVGLLGAAAIGIGVVACGGGGGAAPAASPSDGTAGASAFTQGTLTGFGSIVVNGVHFDDSAATVVDDAGQVQSPDSLKLGMRLDVDSDRISGNSARATLVRFGSIVLGPVAGVDPVAQTVTVLGQTVDVTADTVFDSTLAGGLSALAVGEVIAVHGLPDNGQIIATRIEDATGATSYKLRGTVEALDTTARTFAIGSAVIDYSGIAAADLPATLADGATVRVLLATAPNALGQWVATRLGIGELSKPPEMAAALIRGTITAYTSSTSFAVNGIAVDASRATFPDGTLGLGVGVAVEVSGTVTNGVLVATVVRLDAAHSDDSSHRFTLRGAISALDTGAQTFVVRNVTVSYAGSVTFVNGSAADLAAGKVVDVVGAIGAPETTDGSGSGRAMPGRRGPGRDFSIVQAQTITFE